MPLVPLVAWEVGSAAASERAGSGSLQLAEDREVERFARPEPDDVMRVVGKVFAGFRVREDGQPRHG